MKEVVRLSRTSPFFYCLSGLYIIDVEMTKLKEQFVWCLLHPLKIYNDKSLSMVFVVGGSGAGKTAFFLTPNLLSLHDCNIYTDPKGSLVEELAKKKPDHPAVKAYQRYRGGPIRDKKWFPWEHEQYLEARKCGAFNPKEQKEKQEKPMEECEFLGEESLNYLKLQKDKNENIRLYEPDAFSFMMMDLDEMAKKIHSTPNDKKGRKVECRK